MLGLFDKDLGGGIEVEQGHNAAFVPLQSATLRPPNRSTSASRACLHHIDPLRDIFDQVAKDDADVCRSHGRRATRVSTRGQQLPDGEHEVIPG